MNARGSIAARFGNFNPKWILPVIVPGMAWFAVIRIMWNDWLHDPQYSYGLLVPVLVLGLMLQRWKDRPDPRVTTRVGSWTAALIAVAAVSVLALMIPLSQANPEWRPLAGIASLAAIVISLDLIFIIGGRSWLRHFAFPLIFILIAVPWPRNFEQWAMGQLMSWNTAATLEILHWSGREAMARGNLIMLPCGILGIEEACSGVRSLQSGLMVALFLGEMFRLRVTRRILLLVIAVLAALLGNILRSSLLALVASRNGLASIEAWHDPAGFMVLIVTLGLVILCAIRLKKTGSVPGYPNVPFLPPWLIVSRPRTLVMSAMLAMLGLSLIATEVWFSLHDRRGESIPWSIQSRPGAIGVSPVLIPEAIFRMMFNPEGFSERWISPSGAQGQVFYFHWLAGRTAVQAVSMHNPEVCLRSIGMKMVKSLAPLHVEKDGIVIPFRSWLFEQNGQPVFVFHAIVEEGSLKDDDEAIPDTLRGRLHRLRAARRNAGERMVEVAFWNLTDENSARSELADYLRQTLLVDTPGRRGAFSKGTAD